MTGRGVPDGEMSNFPWRTRPESRTLDALLSGRTEPEEASAGLRPVADVLAALRAPPDPGELAGWDHALTAFRQTPPGLPGVPRRSRRSGPLSSRLRTRLAAAAAAVAVAVSGGGIAAAYAGMLPAALQKIAQSAIAAPGVRPDRAPAATASHPEGPNVTGGAAHCLCNAYAHAKAHGNASQRSEAFRKLVRAAGGEDKVAAYCGTAPDPGAGTPPGHARPGPSATASPASPPHPRHHGKPTAKPSHGNGKKS
jgi:hypothetical protein